MSWEEEDIQELEHYGMYLTDDQGIGNFEKNPTFATFYEMIVSVTQYDNYQCADTLGDMGYKIPVPELKKILEFIKSEGADDRWDQCELSEHTIIESHHYGNKWLDMSDERLEALKPYLDDDDFWENLIISARLRSPKDMSTDALRAMFNAILVPHKKE